MCGKVTAFDKGTVDHKIPHSKGGFTTIENGQWLCIEDNLKKLAKLPES
ncbi:MAG: HNH endonuclease signature motif containing protein [Candidatus Bathyarchaeia archaeon]